MLQSQLFSKIKKESPQEAEIVSHQLLVKADFIDQLASGVYSFLPLGKKVHDKIENIIREEMINIGAQEVYLPVLIPKRLWQITGRWEKIDPPLFKLKDRHGKEFGLGPTHEEVMTELARTRIKSYKDLPLALFQIQSKFRNEMRPTGGLLRVREFIMKDLYSFHQTKEESLSFYREVKKAYFRIFKRCGFEKALCVEAEPGTIGGELSHEFMVLAETGEDSILICQKCGLVAKKMEKIGAKNICSKCLGNLVKKNCIEIGHIFYLGEKYSKDIEANFVNKKGQKKKIIMGCYGIGIGRLMASIVEVFHDERGIIWPMEVAPFQIHLISLLPNEKKDLGEKIYRDFEKRGVDILYDDRDDKTVGEKFAEADLIGIPYRLVISEKTLRKDSVEIKKRSEKKIKLIKIKNLPQFLC
jgi:prolyl-tRNA synthetase